MKNRNQEAFAIFSHIHRNSTSTPMSISLEFENLTKVNERNAVTELLQWKYITRYTSSTSTRCVT